MLRKRADDGVVTETFVMLRSGKEKTPRPPQIIAERKIDDDI